MKNRIFAIAASILALSATFTVHAADDIYKVPATGEVLSTKNVYRIDTNFAGGFLRLYLVGGGENLFADQAGTVAAKILQNQPEFTAIPGTTGYVNANYAVRVSCTAGKSLVSLPNTGAQVSANDGCAMTTAIYNKAK